MWDLIVSVPDHCLSFYFVATPGKKNLIVILSQAHVLGGLEIYVLLSYLYSFFCKWLVINITLVTLKNEVYGIQDQYCFVKPY